MKKAVTLAFGSCVALSLIAASPAGASDPIAKKILELFPQADADDDGVLSAAEDAALGREVLKKFPRADRDGDGVLSDAEKQTLLRIAEARAKRKPDSREPTPPSPTTDKWKTTGLQQANSMGGGEAAIPKGGKFRVFVLMGQSNMQGAARAAELKSPYNKKHGRIRIWANGRWEYFVPRNRFGPGVSMAHQLAELWPDDTIGIIKVASGGTGIRGFEKNWTFERANRTFDGKKGSLYKDLMNSVAEAKRISTPEFCGIVWKQGAADGTQKDLAEAYYATFQQLVADLRSDLSTPDLPVFVLTYLTDEELSKLEQPGGKRRYLKQVLLAHNKAGEDIAGVATVHHGRLSVGKDGVHFNAEGQIKLGKMTASAVEMFYKLKE